VKKNGLLNVEAAAGVAVLGIADARVEIRTRLQNGKMHSTVASLPRRTRVD